jgi:hypothetical protein
VHPLRGQAWQVKTLALLLLGSGIDWGIVPFKQVWHMPPLLAAPHVPMQNGSVYRQFKGLETHNAGFVVEVAG